MGGCGGRNRSDIRPLKRKMLSVMIWGSNEGDEMSLDVGDIAEIYRDEVIPRHQHFSLFARLVLCD